jgi:glucuronoarabinoxylan endo-1,4-beta-xylanase
MTRLSICNLGLVFAIAACSNGNSGGSGSGGGTNGGTGGSAGANTGTGGTTGGTGTTTGGTGGGSTTGGTTGGTATTAGTGTGGSTGGTGVTAGGGGTTSGSAGAPIGGTGQMTTGGGAGMGAGGVDMGSGGMSAGSGPGGSTGAAGASQTGPVTVNLDQTKQTIEGFGINDTWGGTLPSSIFSTTGTDGIGLSLLRVGMSDSGADMSSNIAGDITTATGAGAKVIGSCWSPPSGCKTSGTVNDGGTLKMDDGGKCAGDWSDSIVKWAQGHKLYAMSIGNEPDFASCGKSDPCNGNYPTTTYTANQMVAWVKVAGPKLQKAGIKVIAPEASEWTHQWSNVSAGPDVAGKNSSDPLKCGFPPSNTACNNGDGYDYGHWMAKDADAWKAFDILGVHEYDSQKAEPWPSDVTAARKEVWQTEMSGVKWWPEQGPSCDISNGVAVAGWIHSALTVGEASAWFYWWYINVSADTDDNEGLLLKSGSTASGCDASKPTKRYYALGNYSKFVRPGATAVVVSGAAPTNILLSAYKGSDGTLSIVAINKGTTDATVPITISGGTAPAMLTPNVTSATANLSAGTAVAVSGGTFMAALPQMTITTFVGK